MRKIQYYLFFLSTFSSFGQVNIKSLPDEFKPILYDRFKEPLELFHLFISDNKVHFFSLIIDPYGSILFDKINFYDKKNNLLSKDKYIFLIREISKLRYKNPYKEEVIIYFYTKV